MEIETITTFFSQRIMGLIAAVVIILLSLIIGRVLEHLIIKLLHELDTNKILKQHGIRVPVEELLGVIVKYIVYILGIIFALNQLGLTRLILNIILFSFLLLILAFIILAVKDFIPNVIAGLYIRQKNKIKPDDFIKVNNTEGKVMAVDLIETKIKTKDNDTIFIPNSILIKSKIIKKD